MDIVERLRYEAKTARKNHPETFCVSEDTADEAADEIERLRAGLQKIADGDVYDKDNKLMPAWPHITLARAVLGKDNTVYKESNKDA